MITPGGRGERRAGRRDTGAVRQRGAAVVDNAQAEHGLSRDAGRGNTQGAVWWEWIAARQPLQRLRMRNARQVGTSGKPWARFPPQAPLGRSVGGCAAAYAGCPPSLRLRQTLVAPLPPAPHATGGSTRPAAWPCKRCPGTWHGLAITCCAATGAGLACIARRARLACAAGAAPPGRLQQLPLGACKWQVAAGWVGIASHMAAGLPAPFSYTTAKTRATPSCHGTMQV